MGNVLWNMIEVQAALERVPAEEADRYEEQSRLYVSAAESRRVKRVAPPAEPLHWLTVQLTVPTPCTYQPTQSFPRYRRRSGGCRWRDMRSPR